MYIFIYRLNNILFLFQGNNKCYKIEEKLKIQILSYITIE